MGLNTTRKGDRLEEANYDLFEAARATARIRLEGLGLLRDVRTS